MRTGKCLPTCAATLAILALTVPARVTAQPTQCTAGQLTVTLNQKDTTDPEQITWRYGINGPQNQLNSVKRAVGILPRNVKPSDIIAPPALLDYCDQETTSTKINRGNCNGFPLPVPVTTVGLDGLNFEVVTDNSVQQGLVSFALITGSSTADTCINTDAGRQGILGPASVGPVIQPLAQCLALDGNVSIQVEYGSDACIVEVTSFGNPTCQGAGDGSVPPGSQPANELYSGSLLATGGCPTSLTVGTGSPCILYEVKSGGTPYKFCYHLSSLQPLTACLTHTGICASHP